LLPFRMERGDDGRLHDFRMPAGRVLQRNGADPFATGLDEVLRPIDDRKVAVRIDRGDVAGLEPPFTVERVAGALEIAGGVPRRLDPEMADRHAIVRQRPLVVVDDADLPAEPDATRLHAARAGDAERLGHAPQLIELDAPG